MKTFVELITEVKQCIDQEDNKALANIEDSMESTTVATSNHALGSYLIYDKKVYEVTTAISVGDTLVIYPAIGYNIKVADDIMTMIEARRTEIQTLTNNLSDEVETRAKLGAHQLIPFDLASIKASNTRGTWNGNSYTRDGITYTVELDNYGNVIGFDVDGTGHGSAFVICPSTQITRLLNLPLIMSCNTSPDLTFMVYQYDGTNNLYCYGNDVDVTLTSNVAQLQLYVRSSSDKTFNHFKIYPLLRTEDDPSREFTPFAKTNQKLTEDTNAIEPMLNVLGAKNLLKNTASSVTVNGVTFTVNPDGSVTANGTATEDSTLIIADEITINADAILSGCPAGGGTSTYFLAFEKKTNPWTRYALDTGSGATITTRTTSDNNVYLRIRSGQTVSNMTFKPMIRLASIEDPTYVPYAMTNRELTDAIANSYVFMGVDSITVTAEANDTWETMLEKSRVAINNYLANLEDNEYVRFIALSGAYSGTSLIYDLKKKNDTFSGVFISNGYTNSYATGVQTLIRIASSNKTAIRTTFSTSTGESSTTSVLSDSFGSGLTMTYLIDKFIKVQ